MDGVALLFGANGWAPLLLKGSLITVSLALTAAPFGFGAGLMLALLKLTRVRPLILLADAFTNFFRGIPDLLSLFLIYFGLQALLNWVASQIGPDVTLEMNAFVAGTIALSVVTAAYSSEVWVAALKSVPRGPTEAATALGLSRRDVFRHVTLPLLLRVALPGLGNLWMILLKDTSLISVLAVGDLLRAASEASRATLRPLLFYGAATAIYLVFSIVSGAAQALLERRFSRGFA